MPSVFGQTSIDSPVPRLDIVVKQGETFTLAFLVLETISPRVPIDLTGWFGWARIKNEYDGTLIVDSTTLNGRVTLGYTGTAPDDYNVLWSINASTTDAFTDWGKGVWDFKLIDTFGNSIFIAEGVATLSRAATR